MKLKYRVLIDVVAITLFVLGVIIIHVVQNADNQIFYVLNSKTQETLFFDIGLFLIGLGFFLEFGLKFKPLLIETRD